MTPCEELGYYVGDTFRVTNNRLSSIIGTEIVKLHASGITDRPLFVTPAGIAHYIELSNVRKITKSVFDSLYARAQSGEPDTPDTLDDLIASRKLNLEQIKQLEIENAKIWEEIQKIAKESGLVISEQTQQNKQTEQAEEVVEPKDNEDWIEWKGGECPVEKGTLVDVKYRDGEILTNIRALVDNTGIGRNAKHPFWLHDNDGDDITFYRLSK